MKYFGCLLGLIFLIASCKDNNFISQVAVLDEPFRLKLGQARILHSENLIVGFNELIDDSRCPEDVVCVWEGEAKIGLWLQISGQDTTFLPLTIPGFVTAESQVHASSDTLSFHFMLQQLDPYPNTTQQRGPAAYEALLVISSANEK